MRVLPTTFNGEVNLNVRNHTGIDYLFLLLEEQTNLYTTYDVVGSVKDGVLTLPLNVSLKEDIYYMGYVYPRNTVLGPMNGTITEWWENYQSMVNSGSISDDVCRFKIFSTDQTDTNKYFFNEGQYIEPSENADDEVIIIE